MTDQAEIAKLPIAFIADRLSAAHTDIRREYKIASINGERRGTVEIDGAEVPFVIVQFPDQLLGLWIREYVFLPSALWMKTEHRHEMEWIAKSRVRTVLQEKV
jgi:hypothetical protein